MIKAFTRTGLFVFALTLIGAIQTQAQVIFTEDFETGIPGTWLTIDVDTLTPSASLPFSFTSAWIGAADFSNATDTVAMSTSWYNPAGTSDDWLISPQIPLTAGNVLTWEEKAQDPAYADGYEVRISTTTPTIAGFMANAPLLTVPAASAGVWASQSVDLAAAGYLNQNVYLAWRNNSTDKYILVIDDILVAAGLLPDDVAAVNLYRGTQYTVVPSSQVQALMPNADMTNNVNGAATNPVMNIDISAGGVSQYNNSSTMGSLAGLTTANFAATAPFNTAVVDDYMVIAMASADITDTDPSNNFDTAFYSVSTDVYSRDNNVIVGALGIGNTASGFIGNDFEIVTATYISSLQFYLTSPMMGDTIIAAVYDQVSGTPSNEIASSVPYIITAADTNGVMLQLPIVNGNTALAAGTYTMGVQETFTSNITLAYGTSNYFPGTTWVFFDGTWSNSEDFGFNLAYIVRAVLGCPVPSASFTSSSVDLTATFTNTTSGTADGQFWDFGDGSGDTLQNPVHIYAAPGTYTVCLFAYNGCGLDTICDTVSVTVDLSCDNPTYYSELNIQVDEATLIWNSVPNAIKYKLKIREVGTTTWTNHTIFSPDT
ncbi:MAG: PKD repeat protein, partial [Bacteroidia bacterium]